MKLAKKIERLVGKLDRNILFKYVGITFLCISLILTILSIALALVLRDQKLSFFSDENIDVESFKVEISNTIVIRGLLYVDKDLRENDTNSIPTILLLHGINGRKEHKTNMVYQYVKFGYAVISVEQRGHGESGNPSGFLSKEPYDMIKIIDFIESQYQFANTTYMGLLGFSYGGGIGAILQAIEDRIHAVVLYHPLADLESLLERIPLRYLIGSTTGVTNLDDVQDALNIASETNTKNLLLLQGLSDIIIRPKETTAFFNQLNGANRTDIVLKQRQGKGHEGNEKDITSLKYAISWFEHFYHDQSINISDLENEIESINLFDNRYPSGSISENLVIVSSIFLFIGLSSFVINSKILPFWKNLPIKKDVDNSREGRKKYKKMIIYRTTGYFGALMITGLIFTLVNQSILYGYFVFFPILTSIIMMFIPSELHPTWKEEWKEWVKTDAIPFLYTISIIIVPTVYFILFYNLSARLTIRFTIPISDFTFLPYLIVGLGSGIMDFLYLREMKGKDAMILLVIRPISILIFLGFVPLPPFPILGGITSHVLFILLIGVILYYIRSLVMYLSKFFKNSSSLYLLVMLPFVIFYMRVFFRII
jgi:pimeloyl-ACP methyl ester carboxylesterase